ncbi:uncharacterized protein LOC111390699 [Olea europaea var. sylvestris]|uniref:uncharacterized protein LOC111390699 n=1 Tax=Olea europaea var. sylvestris TaxID=158386 RepID=UPI000C1D1393|nr:uncharacterized protein LOC111390699 [Olea europaea var. sylvestris]
MEVYVDDILVKSIKAKDHCQHLTVMFDILRKYGMKLNPEEMCFRENGIQYPVYYVSKALHEAELRYSLVEKLAFTLLMAARRLRPYFLEHPIEVLTNSPLKQTLQRPDTSGRMVKWAVKLGQFDIKYTPHSSIKSQALVDFVSEFCNVPIEEQHKETPWKLYADGSSTGERSGAGIVLISPDHRIFCEALPFDFKASNNEAEYEALIAGARMALGLGISNLILHNDSQLVVNQVNGVYMAKEDRTDNYLRVVKKELERFNTTQVKQIPRSQNNHADALARLATSEAIEEFDSIHDEITPYLKIGKYLENSAEARKLRTRSARYTLIDNVLYKRGYSTPLLRCDKCQRLTPIINTPSRELNPVTAPWPFAKWGVDLIGPMPIGKEGFGIPHSIVTDNGKRFDNARLSDFCEELSIKKHFSSPNHPQPNGQVEAINKIIKHTLKAKLDLFKGGWAEELSSVLWSYRTTARTSTEETLFSLTFGIKAVIPLEINIPSLRITDYEEERNPIALRTKFNLTEEKMNNAELKNAVYKQWNAKYYNQKVRKREFEVGSLILRKAFLPTREIGSGCLGPNWEGPYLITNVLLKEAYELEDLGGRSLPILGMPTTLSSTISEWKKPPCNVNHINKN